MNRNETMELIKVMDAACDGKPIQYRSREKCSHTEWATVKPVPQTGSFQICWDASNTEYRIKPEVKYRPWGKVDNVPIHGDIDDRNMGEGQIRGYQTTVEELFIYVAWRCNGDSLTKHSAETLFHSAKMEDGSPCGVLED